MGKTPRERLLLTLFPTFLVVAGYVLMFYRGAQRDAALASLATAQASAVTPNAVMAERFQLADKREQKTKLEADKARLDERRAGLARFSEPAAASRTEALRQLSRMLWDRGLYPYDESPAATAEVSEAFEGVLRTLAKTAAVSSNRRLWQVRFYGRYGDVVSTLDSLRESGLPVIPVSITMSEAPDETSWRNWTLLLWI